MYKDIINKMLAKACKNGFGKRWCFGDYEEIVDGQFRTSINKDGVVNHHCDERKTNIRILVTLNRTTHTLTVLQFFINYNDWRTEIGNRRMEYETLVKNGSIQTHTQNIYNYDDTTDGQYQNAQEAKKHNINVTLKPIAKTK